jgi:hypothetical protein
MTGTEPLLNDIGGLPAEPIQRVDHELEPWEKRCHALADVLDFHKIINTEEKRRGVEAAGRRDNRQADLLRALDCGLRQHPVSEGYPDPRRTGAENGRSRGTVVFGGRGIAAVSPNRGWCNGCSSFWSNKSTTP